MKELYKVLDPGLISPYQSFIFQKGKEYHCDDFDPNPDNHCSNGYYAVPIEGLIYAYRPGKPGKHVYEVNVWGDEIIVDQFKQRYEFISIGNRVPIKRLKSLVREQSDKMGYDLYHAMFPVDPQIIKHKLNDIDKNKLNKWDSVWASVWDSVRASVRASVWDSVGDSVLDSVWDSVWDSVGASVGASVRASVWDSVRASVRDSVWDSVGASVWAYISNLFPNINKWYYINHEHGLNPFQPYIYLWERGFIPSFDGKIWRLHQGPDAKIVYEWKPE